MHDLSAQYESPIRVWIGPFLLLGISDPDDIQIVLRHKNSIAKAFSYNFGKILLGDGLLTAPVDIWKSHRKIIAPTFHRSILENYVKIFHRQTDIFVDQLRKCSNSKQDFDLFDPLNRCTLDIILESVTGTKLNCQTSEVGSVGDQYIKCAHRALEITCLRVVKIWLLNDTIFKRSSMGKDFMHCVEITHKIANTVIEEKRLRYENSEEKFDRKIIDQIFEQIYDSNSNWTDDNIRDEISTVILAGSETSAQTLCKHLFGDSITPNIAKTNI